MSVCCGDICSVANFPTTPEDVRIEDGVLITWDPPSMHISGFRYLPRQDDGINGRISQYEFYVSLDGSNWGDAAAVGTFPNDSFEKEVLFSPVTGRFVRVRALDEVNGNPWTTMAELNLLGNKLSDQNSILISQVNWGVHYVDSEETIGENGAAVNAFDGNATTIWHTEWSTSDPIPPHEIQIDLGLMLPIDGFRVYWGTTEGGPYPFKLCEVDKNTLEYLACLDGSKTYYLVCRSYNELYESEDSNEVVWPSR